MRFLLTSGGISNDSIRNTLVDLLSKPIAEANALCIPPRPTPSPTALPRPAASGSDLPLVTCNIAVSPHAHIGVTNYVR